MKLYTEEQVNQAMLLYIQEIPRETIFKEHLIPIELPTVEEIEKKSVEYSTNTETKEFYKDCCWDFQNGAKWMRDKIKGE